MFHGVTMALWFVILTSIFVACHSGTTVLEAIFEMEEDGYLDDGQALFLMEHYPADLSIMMPQYQISSQLNHRLMQYLDAQVKDGALSESRRYYLSTLMHLRNNTSNIAPKLRQRSGANELSIPAPYIDNGNVEFLGQYKAETSYPNFYFGVSGYASDNGREYALLTDRGGLHIIDITTSSNPVQVQYIQMEKISFWRDVETWKHSSGKTYAYVAGQSGGKLYVVDLSGLDINNAATYIKRGFENYGHTVTVREGYLILNTAYPSYHRIAGCSIFNIESDPWAPTLVGTYKGGDCHDSSIHRFEVDGKESLVFIAAGGNTGIWDFVDLESTFFWSLAPHNVIGRTSTEPFNSFAYAHSHTVDTSRNLLYAFEESNVYDIAIWDISDPKLPVFQRTFSYSENDVENSMVHNGHIRRDYLLVAHYLGGFRVFDVSESPDTIVEVGQYNTFVTPELTEWNYEGAWNLYADLPSKKVLVTDTKSGLYIFKVEEEATPTSSTSLSPSERPSIKLSSRPSLIPTADQSKAPSNAPSIQHRPAIPSVTISPTFCDDTSDTFLVPGSNNQQEPCRWLQARPELISTLCFDNTEVRRVCPETCGLCYDYCEDTIQRFIYKGVERDCIWLQGRPFLFPTLCDPNNGAGAHVCPETCNICDGIGLTPPPTTLPSLSPSNKPSQRPSSIPSILNSDEPSLRPTTIPSLSPSNKPSQRPSSIPSILNSETPSLRPIAIPTDIGSEKPSVRPTAAPTPQPSRKPSPTPSRHISQSPSESPSNGSTPGQSFIFFFPTSLPSVIPSSRPSTEPSQETFTDTDGNPSCVSGGMTVELFPGKIFKKVQDLQVGDMVRVRNGANHKKHWFYQQDEFEPIIMFGHYDPNTVAHYNQVTFQDGSILEISDDHLIYTSASAIPKPSSTLRVGQSLPDGRCVTKIERNVVRRGAFAPFTVSGKILVNTISISTYITLQRNQTHVTLWGRNTGWSFHFLEHAAMSLPLVLFPKIAVQSSAFIQNSAYDFAKTYWLNQSPWVAAPLFFVLILPTVLMMNLLRLMMSVNLSPIWIVLMVVAFIFERKRNLFGRSILSKTHNRDITW